MVDTRSYERGTIESQHIFRLGFRIVQRRLGEGKLRVHLLHLLPRAQTAFATVSTTSSAAQFDGSMFAAIRA